MNEVDVGALADAVAKRLLNVGHQRFATQRLETQIVRTSSRTQSSTLSYPTMDQAVEAARLAQPLWVALPLEKRKHIIDEMRGVLRRSAVELATMAVEETGLGRVEDKVKKNLLVINKTPGPEYLEPQVWTGDEGLTLTEYAPYGVIGSITPSTNPSETVINNGISMISAGNAVVFNPHPGAKRTSLRAAELMDHVIVAHGGPKGVITMVESPSLETAQELMKHPGIRLLVVTGGPAVVQAAMKSGKKVIAGGPGNPPVVVDETADLDQAAKGIVAGASFDNNIICTDEKEIICVDEVADDLLSRLISAGAVKLSSSQIRQLEKILVDGHYPKKDFVGKDASVLLKSIGVRVQGDPRLLVAEVEEDHPFVQVEMLMPIVGFVRVSSVEDGVEMAKRVEHGFGHTASMYSKNIDHLHLMARTINTSIFVKNAPNYSGLGFGGEGYTSFTIASPTGEGLTQCRTFSRIRRCTLKEHFRIV